ncbi:MAG: VOC family protein [Crocinitomicaceae bacterium]
MGSTAGKKKKPTKLKNFVSWFEIPAVNFEKAVAFYNHIYDIQMETTKSNLHSMAYFPSNGGIGGAVISGPGSNPNENGPLIYLNGGDDLNNVLGKVEDAGGKIIMTKTLISEDAGYFAIFIDCQGNKLALHSNN